MKFPTLNIATLSLPTQGFPRLKRVKAAVMATVTAAVTAAVMATETAAATAVLSAAMGTVLAALPAAPAAAASASPARAAAFEDTMAQRTLACTSCHGAQGRAGPDGYYPRIAGKPAGYLYNQLLHFRDGRRHYGLMTGLLDPLSDDYLQAIARHFASLDLPYAAPPPPRATPALLERGRVIALQGDASRQVPACAQCHGPALTGVLPNTPGLLGLPRDYLNAQLGAWRSGQRRAHAPDCMAKVATALSTEDLEAVSTWLAAQALPASTRAIDRLAQAPTMACGSAILPAGRARP